MPCVLAETFFAWNRSVKQQIKHHLYTLIYYYNMQLLGLRVAASIFGTFFALEVKILISIKQNAHKQNFIIDLAC